jgi:hypothetical protein
MRRYLLVLETDLLALDDKLGQEPINYLVEQLEKEQSEVVVLSLAEQAKLSSFELVLGAASSGSFAPAKFPVTPQPDHDLSAAAERRMNLTVRQLKTIGFRASGLISDEDLVKAVDAETRSHDYDEIILMTSSQKGSWLARALHMDPIHHLQRQWGRNLTAFTTAAGPSATARHRSSGQPKIIRGDADARGKPA